VDRELRIGPSPGEATRDQAQVKALIDKAERDLKQVVSQKLSGAAQENYKESLRYLKLAKDALNDRNLAQALAAADKAATFAEALVSR